ncbi:MAG: FIST C-terminal domain-containing protein, partial [Polaromonas sp.]|nr:FIST C-terminal domain-containing protein [Polaromonas sp.]
MKLFPYGHATHPQWSMAAGLVLAQLRAHMALPNYASAPTLALLYITDHYALHAQDILDHLSAELPEVTDWSGTVGVGIAANNVEYFDEPALSVMLCDLPPDQYRVFSGVSPLPAASRFKAHTALVHADASTPDVAELIEEMAARTDSGYVFGGLASSRTKTVQFALSGNGNLKGQGAASGVFMGGLSGVAFARAMGGPQDTDAGRLGLMSRVTQGCQPVSKSYQITACEGNVITGLNDQPALEVMLGDLDISLDDPKEAIDKVRRTLVGLSRAEHSLADGAVRRAGQFGADVLVRHLIGLDPSRKGIAIADVAEVGMTLAFCERHAAAARADLMRVCAEIREELEPQEVTAEVAQALGAG